MTKKTNAIINNNAIPAHRRMSYAIGNLRRSKGFVKAVMRDTTFDQADDPMVWFRTPKAGPITINLSF